MVIVIIYLIILDNFPSNWKFWWHFTIRYNSTRSYVDFSDSESKEYS